MKLKDETEDSESSATVITRGNQRTVKADYDLRDRTSYYENDVPVHEEGKYGRALRKQALPKKKTAGCGLFFYNDTLFENYGLSLIITVKSFISFISPDRKLYS
jgi:hypothetical protein